jgi:ABC-type uncharacterized transport system involved in gliding motility auxiliary subunit
MASRHALSIVLIVAVAGLLIFVSNRYRWDADWTYGNRNSLTQASQRVLAAMPGEIKFTAFAPLGPEREPIRNRINRYRRHRDDIVLTFVDPAKNPRKVRELGIRRPGEVRVNYQGRSRSLDDLTEQSVTNVLQQLSVAGEQWVVFLAGHGERDPQDENQGGYGRLARELASQGLKSRPLNLAETPRIPDNTSALVIASPQRGLLPGEVELIRGYVAGGGNLLWLDDPGRRFGLEPLAADLGLRWRDGTVIYPDYRELGLRHPAIALVVGYPEHPVTEHLNALTLFPFAGGLTRPQAPEDGQDTAGRWQAKALLRSPSRSWLDTGSMEAEQITYEESDGDATGPITMGMALTRRGAGKDGDAAQTQQRAAVITDSDFLTNGYVDSAGNLDLGVSLFQWLSHRDRQISVRVPPAPDSSLRLAPWQGRTIWYLFVIVLPAALLLIGVGRWWWRRRR